MQNRLPDSFHNWLVTLRRQFHQFPELQYQEEKTSAKICDILTALNIPFQAGIAGTGVAARVKAERTGAMLAFRADMDALPITEANDVPYKSQRPGLMHACGHDAHITISLGVIRWLKESGWIQNGSGEILFIFQPAEEGGAGAKAMLNTGIFDSEPVKAVFAGHVLPELPAGHIGVASDIANAATNMLRIRLKGKGGHGAYPHQCKDPIVAGAHLVTQLLSRNLPPLESAVVTVGRFHAGTASNIIPEEAFLEGTLRTLDPIIRKQILKRIEEIVRGTGIAFDISADFESADGYPLLKNDPELVKFVRACAGEFLGADHVLIKKPSMGAEDFSYFCQKWGGVMVDLGCRDPKTEFQYGLHSPHFDIDESVLDIGVLLFGLMLTMYVEN
ncbi:MAG: hypothetical protein BWK80_15320 [Desulfobacteraceae bacterium IS3]|nr:MAG: hypothetical protein BWK80_15320 [Desulfobacteraceae bacterium IS3]